MNARAASTRRRILIGAGATWAALTAGGALAACGPGETAAPKASSAPVTITYSFWGDPDSVSNHELVVRTVMERQPNITVKTMHIPDDYLVKLTALFVAGSPPDVAIVDMQDIQAVIKQQVLLDVNPLIGRDKGTLKPEDIDARFLTHIKDAAGKLYGLPRQQSVNCIFFNENLFTAAGLPSPLEQLKADKWTWEAFLTGAQRTTKRDASGVLQQLGIRSVLERGFIWAAGGKEFDDPMRPKRCLYDSAEAIDAMQFQADLRFKYKVHQVGSDKLPGGDDFTRGNVAMATYWTSSLNSIKAIKDFNWSVVPYPKKKDYATDSAGLHPLSIAKASKAQDAGWELVKFPASVEGQTLLAKVASFTPIRKSVLADAAKLIGMPQATLFTDFQKYGALRLVAPGRPEISRIMTAETNGLWAGTEEAKTACQRVAEKVNQYLKDNPQG